MIRRRAARALLSVAIALVAAVAAVGCAVSGLGQPASVSTSAESECGRSPGTKGIWRPQIGYCEY